MSKKSIDEFCIEYVLKELSKVRPLFHNERDFQFEIALIIKEMYDVELRLEYYVSDNKKNEESKYVDNRQYLDLLVFEKNKKVQNKNRKCIIIELKYKTKEWKNDENSDEQYNLKNQGAKDYGSYYIYRDLKRIEEWCKNYKDNNLKNYDILNGYVVFLTNDDGYWLPDKKMKGIFRNYNLNYKEENGKYKVEIEKDKHNYFDSNGKEIKFWSEDKFKDNNFNKGRFVQYNPKSTKNKPPIKFDNSYYGVWNKYSNYGENEKNEVWQLIIPYKNEKV